MSDRTLFKSGDVVFLEDEVDCIVPAGLYEITSVNPDGSFHVEGGNTAIWPRRVSAIRG